ncbi:hypothetical protein F2Q68_00003787 [Brassica cretica]|uniref:Uncharacterized protein n=1 Tax=Brassica cretica TaxID=69181 RepID=A0A8S9JDI3_BRACR|nr:hypothetical protein F2Q68_00003787 [Brassica cretica]
MGLFSFWKLLKEVVGMLNESRKLFLKNKKLMFSVFVFYLLLNGLLYLFNVLTITPEITNLTQDLNLLPTMDPSSPEYMAQLMKVFADFRLFVVSSDIFNAVSFIINLLSVLVIVQASALTYKHENVKFKDFVVLILKSWKGPLVTSFYISLFSLGYCLFFVIILFPILLSSLSIASLFSLVAKVFVLLVLFLLFASYLAIVHESQSMINSNGGGSLALGAPTGSQSQHLVQPPPEVNLFNDWSNTGNRGGGDGFLSEEEIRARSNEMLENDDMQQLLRLFSMSGGGGGGPQTPINMGEDGFGFNSFGQSSMGGYGEDRSQSGKPVVGWLKIKAAMRWGFFIRRKAAQRRARIVELDDDE